MKDRNLLVETPPWWAAMEVAAMHEAMAVAYVRFMALNHERRERIKVQETGFRWAWSIFQNTPPESYETPDAYLARLETAIRDETGPCGHVQKRDWAAFTVGIEWLLVTLQNQQTDWTADTASAASSNP